MAENFRGRGGSFGDAAFATNLKLINIAEQNGAVANPGGGAVAPATQRSWRPRGGCICAALRVRRIEPRLLGDCGVLAARVGEVMRGSCPSVVAGRCKMQ